MSTQYIQQTNDPSLKDVLDQLKRNIFLELNCHHIGTIQSFDAGSQTAQVTINYPKTIFKFNPTTRNYDTVTPSYTTLIDCPVVVLSGGDAALTMPIKPGDECIVLCNDRSI